MMQSIAKFDALSDMRVPFEVAAWARGHKYNPTTVNILRKLSEINSATARMDAAERERDTAEGELRVLCEEAKIKMGASNAV